MGKTYTIQFHTLIGGRAKSVQKALFVLFGLLFSFQMSFGSNVTEHEALTSSFYDTTTYKLLSSEIFEAEDALGDIANITDVVNTNVGLREPDAASKKKVAYIPDPGDKIKIPFTIDADGDYVFFVRLRSGDNGNANYTINVDGIEKNFTLINGSISPKSPDLGGSYWSTLEIDGIVNLSGTDHYIEIQADGFFQAVDFIEVGEVDMAGPYSGPLPAPGNLTLKELNSTKLNIGWDAVPGVTGYKIEVADNKGGTYTTLETVDRYSLYYQHSGLSEGTTKAYKITALRYEPHWHREKR
ncbi:fibronectin type III domain-containing protein [Flexithrix dorotheae]|uniref:fibronectin type III domain-containing protein n=1 Tax=Flexithrix dorotheae TaxID=70993 RepID=UPI00036CDFF2|nr:fibronectin type III domain-containing protein [Flexithrix dorotheae]